MPSPRRADPGCVVLFLCWTNGGREALKCADGGWRPRPPLADHNEVGATSAVHKEKDEERPPPPTRYLRPHCSSLSVDMRGFLLFLIHILAHVTSDVEYLCYWGVLLMRWILRNVFSLSLLQLQTSVFVPYRVASPLMHRCIMKKYGPYFLFIYADSTVLAVPVSLPFCSPMFFPAALILGGIKYFSKARLFMLDNCLSLFYSDNSKPFLRFWSSFTH